MNFIHAVLEEGGGQLYAVLGERRLPLAYTTRVRGKADIGIRPVDIKLMRRPKDGFCWEARVRSVLPTGAKQIVETTLGRQIMLVKSARDTGYKAGDTVFLKLGTEHIYLFDSSTKERIREDGGGING